VGQLLDLEVKLPGIKDPLLFQGTIKRCDPGQAPGLFLIAERHFEIGDVIRIGQTTGEVLSIDLLSVKLRTFDNLLVRIPNETMVKTEVTNLTYFAIRRLDVKVGVGYGSDLERVRETMLEVADKNSLCLQEPKPMFIIDSFGEAAIHLQLSVWAARDNAVEVKNEVMRGILTAFATQGIEFAQPLRATKAV
jgi:small-conductance mechanosensitive channel